MYDGEEEAYVVLIVNKINKKWYMNTKEKQNNITKYNLFILMKNAQSFLL